MRGRAAAAAGDAVAARLAGVAAEEARVDAATAEFLRAALPAAPALLLGFLCREGALLARGLAQAPRASLCTRITSLMASAEPAAKAVKGSQQEGAGVPCAM